MEESKEKEIKEKVISYLNLASKIAIEVFPKAEQTQENIIAIASLIQIEDQWNVF